MVNDVFWDLLPVHEPKMTWTLWQTVAIRGGKNGETYQAASKNDYVEHFYVEAERFTGTQAFPAPTDTGSSQKLGKHISLKAP